MRLALFVLILLAVLAARLRAEEVDLELLLLVDVSRSMSPAELEIQWRGYAEALTSGQVAAALGRTMTGRIALAYVEWAGESRQTTVNREGLGKYPTRSRSLEGVISMLMGFKIDFMI